MLYANLHLGTLNETNELASCAPVSPNDAVRSQVVVNGSGKVLGMDYLFQVRAVCGYKTLTASSSSAECVTKSCF